MDIKKLITAGTNQIMVYTALIIDMNRHEQYAHTNPMLARFNGQKAIERLEYLSKINEYIYNSIGEHVFYTG